eukprot:c38835_g1_i1.p1 GENE.c38835_g1_i1~~c38835_g1_i1.p1  ORF type:complete len:287 (+),score=44.59 c38835_g1_i1:54-863(+)
MAMAAQSGALFERVRSELHDGLPLGLEYSAIARGFELAADTRLPDRESLWSASGIVALSTGEATTRVCNQADNKFGDDTATATVGAGSGLALVSPASSEGLAMEANVASLLVCDGSTLASVEISGSILDETLVVANSTVVPSIRVTSRVRTVFFEGIRSDARLHLSFAFSVPSPIVYATGVGSVVLRFEDSGLTGAFEIPVSDKHLRVLAIRRQGVELVDDELVCLPCPQDGNEQRWFNREERERMRLQDRHVADMAFRVYGVSSSCLK